MDVLLEATPSTPLGVIAEELGRLRDGASGRGGVRQIAPILYVDGLPLDLRRPLGGSPVRDGCVVSLDDPAGCLQEDPPGVVELRVTGGPAAGAVHQLSPGTVVVGSGAGARLRVADPHLAVEAFTLAVYPDGDCELVLRPGVEGRLDGERLPRQTTLRRGAQVAVGGSLFEIQLPSRADAVLAPSPDGLGFDYNRPPRVRPDRPPLLFRLPTPPGQSPSQAFPVAMVLSTLVLSLGTALIFGQPAFLLLALLGPLVWIVQYLFERRQGRRSHATQVADYEARCAEVEAEADGALAAERAQRRRDFPDPASLLLTATGPRSNLWQRRRNDPDFLALRVGTGTVGSNVRVEQSAPGEVARMVVRRLVDSPVVVPLLEHGVLGVAGAGDLPRALGRWLVGQVVALHSPLEVRVCVLTDASGQRDWEWVRWLPHTRPALARDVPVALGNDEASVSRRLEELAALLAARQRAASEAAAGRTPPSQPAVVVVLDGARQLRALPGVVQLLREGPAAGIYAMCLDADERRLPGECRALVAEEGWALRVQGAGAPAVDDVRRDVVGPDWCQRLARGLAPLRDISDRSEAATLPTAARLLEVLDLEPPTAKAIAARWRRAPASTRAPMGVAADGPFALDLDERRDGPHGLIAGTTGSGKSELLQTLIASLAVANRPDEMTFVLVDYKGGAAFADCSRLPHTVGMVTDLDGHLTRRALESLAAELRRREALLGRVGAKDVEAYADLRRADVRLPPLPRLLIAIDEFASLVAELPEFVAGLVDIARRGRSLGVHLILATQRPAGVVTPDIRANANLRVALRVTDAADSTDVIEAPDAAGISQSTPGRCFVRSGTAPLRAVQAARVGGRRPGTPPAAAHSGVRLVPMRWEQLGQRLLAPATVVDDAATTTDLQVLVEAVCAAAAGEDVARQPSPWLPPLPDEVMLDALPGSPAGATSIPFGLTDLPAAQARGLLALDLVAGGHLAIVGSPQTGRSTALRTIAGSLAARVGPADVHLYAIDCGANALLPLVTLPHCGAVAGRAEVDRVERLLARLRHEVGRRQQLLAATGFSGLAEQRERAPAGERLPWMVLLLDRWEGFVAAYENYDYGRLIEEVVQLLREGPAVGVRAAFTGDRTMLAGPVSTVFERRLVLRMADPTDYGAAGINERSVPGRMPPGRVVSLEGPSGGLQEGQIALLDPEASGTAQVGALQRLARAAAESFERPPRQLWPLHVDALPARVTDAEARALDPGYAPGSALWALLGAGGDQLGPVGVDLVAEGPAFVVAGPPRSGRSTALLTMARSLLEQGVSVVLVTPRRSPLADLAGAPGVLAVLDAEADDASLRQAVADRARCAVVVDDAELLKDTPLDDVLAELLRQARDTERGIILASTTDDLKSAYRGFLSDALRSRSGLLLSVRSPDEGDLFGVRLPRNLSSSGPRGRGLLIRLGVTMPVQIATQDES